MAKKVFIGVGHGGTDPGAVANGLKEKDVNLTIALACQAELARHGVSVLLSRTKDETENLNSRVQECNSFDPDLAADLHNNAGGGDGAEVFHHYKGGTSKTLAVNILDEVVKIGQNSRGAKTKTNSSGKDYYGFIRNTVAPAVVVECAFLDNKTDVQIIDTTAEQQAMGVAIAKGILKTLGIAYIAPAAASVKTCTIYPEVLKKGAKGPAVKAMQILLIGYGYSCGDKGVDGSFGGDTERALEAFQKDHGLTPDKSCGAKTWTTLVGR